MILFISSSWFNYFVFTRILCLKFILSYCQIFSNNTLLVPVLKCLPSLSLSLSFTIGHRVSNRSEDHPYLRPTPNPFMGHIHPGQVSAIANSVHLLKDNRLTPPTGGMDINGTTDPNCRPNMTDVFPTGSLKPTTIMSVY